MASLVEWMDRKFYPEYGKNWDDLMFREAILANLSPSSTVLDVGAGAGIVEAMNFRDKVARICGVDLDERVADNPMLHEGRVADAAHIPYPDASFDLVFADNVMEHLERPTEVFAELARVLKPGGKLLFKTPNRTHYMPMIARMTPHWFHQYYNRKRGRDAEDTFPTCYRANARRDIELLAGGAGLVVSRVKLIEGRPEYLRMSALTYVAGLLYERFVNATEAMAGIRILIIAELRKPV
jgi:ubiquinone/menaquinone biosynthesis C-methylase UbiE